jgi:hypothetical protein
VDTSGDERDLPRARRRRRPWKAPLESGATAGEPRPSLGELLRDSFQRLAAHAGELRADLLVYAKARKQRLGLGTQSMVFNVAAGLILLVFGISCLAITAWLALTGLVGGLWALLGLPIWAGSLIVGLGLPFGLIAVLLLVKRSAERRQLEALKREYAELDLLRRDALSRRAEPPPSEVSL